jgi:predicted transcriptional regulator with HTH domain
MPCLFIGNTNIDLFDPHNVRECMSGVNKAWQAQVSIVDVMRGIQVDNHNLCITHHLVTNNQTYTPILTGL